MRKYLVAMIIVVVGLFLLRKKDEVPQVEPQSVKVPSTVVVNQPEEAVSTEKQVVSPPAARPTIAKVQNQKNSAQKKEDDLVLPYVLDDGLAVVQGDIVLGQPSPEDTDERGVAAVPPLRLWPTTRIAYHIQPSLPNPERVRDAIAMFDGTVIQFVPYTNEHNVIVFEPGNGICKSYVGWIGGKQPIWLPANCLSHEVAHEIMHALGFVHEQNRDDRDQFIVLHADGIDEKYKANFDKLPSSFMRLSGLSPFDFESIMLYPDWMFAKNGRRTMESKIQGRQILPRETPSVSDLDRINQAYGAVPPQ